MKSQRENNRKHQEKRRRVKGVPTQQQVNHVHQEMFFVNCLAVHGTVYDYSSVVYKGASSKVDIRCNVHGIFKQSPNQHVNQKQGCPLCAKESRSLYQQSRRRTTLQFNYEASLKHSGVYTYDDVEYINLSTKVVIGCPTHGKFNQTPKAHLRGQGCPECANIRRAQYIDSMGERTIKHILTTKNIKFTQQKTYDGCKHKNQLRYDFYLDDFNVLIEYDGQQHYKFFPRFHKNVEQFTIMQTRDIIKNEFAQANNIELLRIRWDGSILDEIESLLCRLDQDNKA